MHKDKIEKIHREALNDLEAAKSKLQNEKIRKLLVEHELYEKVYSEKNIYTQKHPFKEENTGKYYRR